jgi:hypothetical protein
MTTVDVIMCRVVRPIGHLRGAVPVKYKAMVDGDPLRYLHLVTLNATALCFVATSL